MFTRLWHIAIWLQPSVSQSPIDFGDNRGEVRDSDVVKVAGVRVKSHLRSIGQVGWHARALKAAWLPPTDLRTRPNLMQEIPCSTSVGPQRLRVFMLSPSTQLLLLELDIWALLYLTFLSSRPAPISPLYPLGVLTSHWNGTSSLTEKKLFWHYNYLCTTVFAFH